ncbi:MAG TPA: chemotaxis protein CheA, partial [Spirochaetota bacterium]|nr:chemotaxis protein CheA [Spirochaetota bacterium]
KRIEIDSLELEKNPDDGDLIDSIFRSLHTIKGSGSMFGAKNIADFTHEVETVFDLIRKNELKINKEIINLTLEAKDYINYLLENIENDNVTVNTNLLNSFRKLNPKHKEENKLESINNTISEKKSDNKSINTYRIFFKPIKEIFLRGVNLFLIFKEINELGDALVMPQSDDLPDFDNFNPELCYYYWTIILSTTKSIDDIKDVFIFVEDYSEITVEEIDNPNNIDLSNEGYKKIGEILLERNEITREQIEEILKLDKPFGQIAVEKGIISEDKIQSALDEQSQIKKIRNKRKELEDVATIRVNYNKLDDLVNLVGELVTLQAQFTQYSLTHKTPQYILMIENLERLTQELRDHSMDLRMIPISETFDSLNRLVRDLSQNLAKSVNLVTFGNDTELDKNIIDSLKDPLVHIVRNCIDHGIETPDIRESLGKNKSGTITISAQHEGANVLIKIEDDGAGLNRERILSKALEKGLIRKDDNLTDQQIYELIFLPGFSTAQTTTEISGRGVGMDIVKKNIEHLRGTIQLSSQHGAGTTISLLIPLTLAIIDGLLVNVGSDYFILNLSIIDECFDFTKKDKENSNGKNVINIRGEMIPFIELRNLYKIEEPKPAIEQLAVTKINNEKVGIVVDNILGQHQTVVKSIGKLFSPIEEISGATILGDGTVALVLDVSRIYQNEVKKKKYVN